MLETPLMVLDQRTVERRLSELDEVIAALRRMTAVSGGPLTAEALDQDLALRWSLERGLLAAANLVIDTANHIAAGHFAVHAETYEDGLRLLGARGVVDDTTYSDMRGSATSWPMNTWTSTSRKCSAGGANS